MVRAIIGFMVLGGVLCFFGYQEYQVSQGTSAEPVPISLIKLEHGVDPPNNHLQISEHIAIYEGLVYSYTESSFAQGEPEGNTRVQYVYYPIISRSHPFMKALAELENCEPEEFERRAEELSLDNFKVLVRSGRFKTVADLPEMFVREESVTGMVVNQISSLGRQERSLLRESFPELNFDELIILQEGRTPSSPNFSFGLMGGGGAMVVLAALFGVFALRS